MLIEGRSTEAEWTDCVLEILYEVRYNLGLKSDRDSDPEDSFDWLDRTSHHPLQDKRVQIMKECVCVSVCVRVL